MKSLGSAKRFIANLAEIHRNYPSRIMFRGADLADQSFTRDDLLLVIKYMEKAWRKDREERMNEAMWLNDIMGGNCKDEEPAGILPLWKHP